MRYDATQGSAQSQFAQDASITPKGKQSDHHRFDFSGGSYADHLEDRYPNPGCARILAFDRFLYDAICDTSATDDRRSRYLYGPTVSCIDTVDTDRNGHANAQRAAA